MWKQQRGKDSLPTRFLDLQLTSPGWAAGVWRWHTHPGMSLAQGPFSAHVFLEGHARRHICVYCQGWELPTGANYWPFLLHKGASVWGTLCPAWESLSHSRPFPAAGNELFGLDLVAQMVPPAAGSASRSDPRQLGGHLWQGEAKIHLHLHQTPQADEYLWLLPHPASGLMDLQTTKEACSALNMAQSKCGEKKNHSSSSWKTEQPDSRGFTVPADLLALPITASPVPWEGHPWETEPSPDENPAGIFSGSTQCARLGDGRLVLNTSDEIQNIIRDFSLLMAIR